MNRSKRKFSHRPLALAALVALALMATAAEAAPFTWQGGSADWSNALFWSGGGVPNGSSHDVFIDAAKPAASTVSLDITASIGNLGISSGDWLAIAGGGRLYSYGGSLSNAGLLSLSGSDSSTLALLSLQAQTTLGGAGETVLANAFAHMAGPYGLTIASGHTLSGGGQLGSLDYGKLPGVVNQGLIAVTGFTGMQVNLFGTLDNSAGSITVADLSRLDLNAGTLSGGTLQSGGIAGLRGSAGTFRDLSLIGRFNLHSGSYQDIALAEARILPGGRIHTAGSLLNTGTLSLAGTTAARAELWLSGDTVLSGAGRTVMGSAQDHIVGDHSLTIAAGHTLEGSGQLGSFVNALGGVINRGLIAVSGADGLQTRAWSIANSSGTITVAEGSFLDLQIGTLTGGVIQGGGATAELRGGGIYDSAGIAGPLSLYSGAYKNVALSGALGMAAGGWITVAGTVTNTGSLSFPGSAAVLTRMELTTDTTLAGSGRTLLGGAQDVILGHHVLTVAAEHRITGSGQIGYSSSGGLSGLVNRGLIEAGGGPLNLYAPSIENQGRLRIATGATMETGFGQDISQTTTEASTVVNGELRLRTLIIQAGELRGSGAITGTVQMDGGLMSPGDGADAPALAALAAPAAGLDASGGSVGSLGVNGLLKLGPASLLRIDVDQLDDSNGHDLIQISGSATLGGTVLFDFGSFSPTAGQSFVFLAYTGGGSGTFDAVSATGGYEVTLSYEAHGVRATIAAAVPDAPSSLLMLSGLLAMAGVARRRLAQG